MNIENMKKLRDWLEAGAPHAILDMRFGVDRVEDIGESDFSSEDEFTAFEIRVNEKGIGDCGTVCCIAGAAQMMSLANPDEIFPSMEVQQGVLNSWKGTKYAGLNWLGLEPEHEGEVSWFGHHLFSSDLAPRNCTPKQAAKAVQNVMDGKKGNDIWEGV